jgi:DNA-binding transcriptional MerR regulator
MQSVNLTPNRPPGRANRKLRSYVEEIKRLRNAGYTIDTIKETLREAGLDIAWSTVQREAARAEDNPSRLKITQQQTPSQTINAPTRTKNLPAKQPQKNLPRDTASEAGTATLDIDQFFKSHINNPLLHRRRQN